MPPYIVNRRPPAFKPDTPEEIARTIDSEIAQAEGNPWFLHKFSKWLPYGGARLVISEALRRDEAVARKELSAPALTSGERKTVLELINDINVAVYEEGIPLEKIEALQEIQDYDVDAYEELMRLTIPVFKKLRQHGYQLPFLQG